MNIPRMLVTLWTAQPPMFWSKDEADKNIQPMLVTPEVSHAPMSSLKDAAASWRYEQAPACAQNNSDMSVTLPVSHVEMWPYVASAAVASEIHALTAVLMLLSVMTLFTDGRCVGFGTGRGVGAGAAPLDVATVGRGDGFDVGRGVGSDVSLDVGRSVGFGTGRGVGADVQPPCTTPHDVDSHRV